MTLQVTLRQQRIKDVSPKYLMKCGHAAEAFMKNGDPICVICWPSADCMEVVADMPDLSARVARCTYFGKPLRRNECPDCTKLGTGLCGCEKPSAVELAFFEYLPDEPTDRFFCGCHGWD